VLSAKRFDTGASLFSRKDSKIPCFGMGAAEVKAAAPEPSADEISEYGKGPFWTCDGSAEAPIRYAKSGIGSDGVEPVTLVKLMQMACEKKGDKAAMRTESPCPPLDADRKAPPPLPLDQWKQWTFQEYYDETKLVAKGMIALGHKHFDAVNIFGFNSPEWFMAEMGGIFAGGRSAGIYPSDTAEQVAFKSSHSGAAIACLENEGNFKKFSSVIDQMPKLKAIVSWSWEPNVTELKRKDGSVVKVLSWAALLALGKEQSDDALNERIANMKPGHCACLIYTSGTTGNPKAVMISHDNIIFEARMVLDLVPNFTDPEEERIVSYLPLSHVAGMMVDIVCPIAGAALTPGWACVHFARHYDLKVGSIGDRLRTVKPTLFLGVPRVWEKIAEKMKAVGAATKGAKKAIATWAKGKGLEHARNCELGGNGAYPYGYGVANILLKKIKLALGLEFCKFGFTGAAPITKETLEYFGQLGIQINEVYGMSECCGATTFSTDSTHVWGSCGFGMMGTEVKVFKCDPKDFNTKTVCPRAADVFAASDEEQGEICFRGRHIMMGYLANPDLGKAHVEEIKKKNAGAIDAEGWLHSGDKGCMSTTGMVKITGRYKELIITAGGENIAPVPIEDTVKKNCPAISNIMMVGDQRKYNVAILTLKCEGASGEEPGTEQLAGEALLLADGVTTVTAACSDPKVAEAITAAIKATNNDGSCCPSNASKIQKFTILPLDVSVTTGELGPTLKLKRGVVMKKYKAVIDAMYADGAKGPYVNTLAVAPGAIDVQA